MILSQQATQRAQSEYAAQRAEERRLADERVAAEQAALEQQQKDAAKKKIKLGTLITNPKGVLGNPVLSATQLTGGAAA